MSYRQQQPKPVGGFYPQTKVYNDGSHYIAIPHTERPYRPKKKHVEEVISVPLETEAQPPTEETENSAPAEQADALIGVESSEPLQASILNAEDKAQPLPKSNESNVIPSERKLTRKQLFNELYAKTVGVKKIERRKRIVKAMRPYFNDEKSTTAFVNANFERKQRNLICRRVRLTRKVNLQDFNYFVTLTYFYGHYSLLRMIILEGVNNDFFRTLFALYEAYAR